MRLSRLKIKVVRQARRERRRGRMSEEDFDACMKVVASNKALAELNEKVEAEVNPWNRADGLTGAGFKEWIANAIDWFKEHWPEILALILKLAPLLLILEPADEDS